MKRALKILAYVTLVIFLLIAGTGIYLYVNQDKIIEMGISKLNSHLKAPVVVKTIDLDLFSGFPRVRVVLNDVLIEDPFGSEDPLIRADEVGLGMNVFNVIMGDYTIEELAIHSGELHLSHEKERGDNWDLLISTDTTNSELNISHVEVDAVQLFYNNEEDNAQYETFVAYSYASGIISNEVKFELDAGLEHTSVTFDESRVLNDAPLEGYASVQFNDSSWTIESEELNIGGNTISLSLDQQGGKMGATEIQVPDVLTYMPIIELPDDLNIQKLTASLNWEGTYEDWKLGFSTSGASFEYNNIFVPSLTCVGRWDYGMQRALSIPTLEIKTQTGLLNGSVFMKGEQPQLSYYVSGGSNLNELFSIVQSDLLIEPMGFWQGEKIEIHQTFDSWEHLNPLGDPEFEGKIQITEGSFGLINSNIIFDKIEAELEAKDQNIAVKHCLLSSEGNTAEVKGMIYHALEPNGYPIIELSLESPSIDIDPILFWEFDDSPEDADEESAFDYQVKLSVDHVNLGDFNGKDLRGTVFNRGAWMLGQEMIIKGCDGRLEGNWALYESGTDNVFRAEIQANSIELDQLMSSFNSFEIEDLDASNLLGEANLEATLALTFDQEWEQISHKTLIEGQGEIRNGTLQNYAPLLELSTFIDQGELKKINFPYLKSTFRVHGDTLQLQETKVDNSALNLWVNGWQNLATDDIRYSVRLGLKDLALRGKNSNRDLGNWISEAENENQPYIRLIVGCNLDDVCISLDKARISQSFKETLKQEKQDFINIFKPIPEEEKKPFQETPSSGTFELVWPEDSLSASPRMRF